VQLVTGTTLIGILSFVGVSSIRGSLRSISLAYEAVWPLLAVFLGEEPLLLFSNGWEVIEESHQPSRPAFHRRQPPRKGCTESCLHALAY